MVAIGKGTKWVAPFVYSNAPEHRAELIDAAENEIKRYSTVSVQRVCLRRSHMTVSHRDSGWWGTVGTDMRRIGGPLLWLRRPQLVYLFAGRWLNYCSPEPKQLSGHFSPSERNKISRLITNISPFHKVRKMQLNLQHKVPAIAYCPFILGNTHVKSTVRSVEYCLHCR